MLSEGSNPLLPQEPSPRHSSIQQDDWDDTHGARSQFGSRTEYILSMVGYCVGLGNVWRWPYQCFR